VENFFGDLCKGTSAHLALEDRFMRERGYDPLAAHKSDHERLLDEIRDHDRSCRAARSVVLTSFETHDARWHRR
jgi:hemerythrin